MGKRIVAQASWVAPDFVPETFGWLTTISSKYKPITAKYSLLDCVCVCGSEVTVLANNLYKGHTQSCGCYKMHQIRKANKTHGKCDTPEYQSWRAMWSRCRNKSNKNYGARGISVIQEEWKDFEKFLSDMGTMPQPNMSIERKENSGPYCKANCIWANSTEQANNRRSSKYLEYQGKRLTISQWVKELGTISAGTLQARIASGWPADKALSTPVYALGKYPRAKKGV